MELKCEKVNILIGKPNSGKSNILEAIGFLSYIGFGGDAVRYLRTNISRELFYDKDISNKMNIQTDVAEINAIGDGIHVKWHWKVIKQGAEEGLSSGPDGNPPSPPTGRIRETFRVFRFYRYFKPGEKSEPIDYLRPPDGENLLGILYSNSKLRMVFNFAVIESNKNAIIALEEPESHAFPFYVRLLAEAIARDTSNQYFISTHNPYFLITILEKTPKDDVNVIVTDYSDYETKIYVLPKDKFSEILSMDIDVFFNLNRLLR